MVDATFFTELTRLLILEVIPEIRFPIISLPQLNALETILENAFLIAENTFDSAFRIFPVALLTPDTILLKALENPLCISDSRFLVSDTMLEKRFLALFTSEVSLFVAKSCTKFNPDWKVPFTDSHKFDAKFFTFSPKLETKSLIEELIFETVSLISHHFCAVFSFVAAQTLETVSFMDEVAEATPSLILLQVWLIFSFMLLHAWLVFSFSLLQPSETLLFILERAWLVPDCIFCHAELIPCFTLVHASDVLALMELQLLCTKLATDEAAVLTPDLIFDQAELTVSVMLDQADEANEQMPDQADEQTFLMPSHKLIQN